MRFIIATVLAVSLSIGSAQATVIDFQGGSQTNGFFSNYTEGDVKIEQLDSSASWNPYVWHAGLHLDNSWVKISFIDDSLFDLVNLDWDYLNGSGASYLDSLGNSFTSLSTLFDQTDFGLFGQGIEWFSINGGIGGYAEKQIKGFEIVEATAVPEPSSLALFGLGLAGLSLTRKRK